MREWTYFALDTAALHEKLAHLPSSSVQRRTRVVKYDSLADLQRDEQAYTRVRDMVGRVHGEGGSGHHCAVESILEDDAGKPALERARYLLYYVRAEQPDVVEPAAASRIRPRDEELRRMLPPDHPYQHPGGAFSILETLPRQGRLPHEQHSRRLSARLLVVHAVVHDLDRRQRRVADHLRERAGGDPHAPSTIFGMETRERVEHELYLHDAQVHASMDVRCTHPCVCVSM